MLSSLALLEMSNSTSVSILSKGPLSDGSFGLPATERPLIFFKGPRPASDSSLLLADISSPTPTSRSASKPVRFLQPLPWRAAVVLTLCSLVKPLRLDSAGLLASSSEDMIEISATELAKDSSLSFFCTVSEPRFCKRRPCKLRSAGMSSTTSEPLSVLKMTPSKERIDPSRRKVRLSSCESEPSGSSMMLPISLSKRAPPSLSSRVSAAMSVTLVLLAIVTLEPTELR
mmetsp:Transcript_45143/g.118443  ORF Transcript_45143/g.118443 Transcript_45143/m.118443 type:complete len:229 (-) Transcript_45143:276-962(-)